MNNDNNNENKVVYLRLDDILPNRFQPREVFDETGLEELADSIKEHGVIQPVIVRQMGDKYELIAGERRSKATAMAGLTTIPAIVRNMDDKESAKVSLLENLQRKNLSAIEEARTYKKILELDNLTQDDLAKTMGKSQPLIANKLRLLSLPEEVQDALIKNQISERHARSLLNLKDKKEQLILLDRIRNERLTVRELDMEIRKINGEFSSDSDSSSSDTRMAYNTFNSSSMIPNFNANVRTNFGNMGLNDYQTSVNSNMFNNIPSDYQFSANRNDNDPFTLNDNKNTSMNEHSDSDNEDHSLVSMLDSNSFNTSENIKTENDDFENNSSLFISQIKQDDIKPQENQFLPNFDTDIYNNFNSQVDNANSNLYDNKVDNNTVSFEESYNNFMNINESDDSNFKQNSEVFNETLKDIENYSANQGSLFNQPLNIVEIPRNDYLENNNYDTSSIESNKEIQTEKFDNPFDDPYENILFAKPVAVKFDDKETKEEDVEVIDNSSVNIKQDKTDYENTLKKEEKYISLEPEKTIFDVRGAVLELKKTTDEIKLNKINIDTEEIDFDDYYQIIIKIKK